MQSTKYTEEFVKSLGKKVADAATAEEFAIPLSAKLIANMREAVTRGLVPTTHLLIGSAVWPIIIADAGFQMMVEPATPEDVIAGYMGRLFGMDILSDAFFHPEERCMPRNFCAVVFVKQGEEFEVGKAVSAYVE